MILGIGTDVASVSRIGASYQRHGQRFLDRVYSPDEQAYCLRFHDPSERLAARWAAKEAFLKALGSGLVGDARLYEIEVLHDSQGAPQLRWSGAVEKQIAALGPLHAWCSLSHAADLALAMVILERAN